MNVYLCFLVCLHFSMCGHHRRRGSGSPQSIHFIWAWILLAQHVPWSSRINHTHTLFCAFRDLHQCLYFHKRIKRSFVLGLELMHLSRQVPRYFAVTICLSWGFSRWPFLKTGRARMSLMRFTFLDNASRLPCFFPNFDSNQMHPENFRCVPPKRSIRNSSSFRRIEIIGLRVLRYTTLDFSSQNNNCSLSTFSSRPRAEVTSHQQHVDIGNACNKKTSVSRLVTATHGMMPINTRRSFSSCQPQTRDFNSSRKTGLQTVWVFHFSLFLHFLYWRGHCSGGEFLAYLHFIPRCPHGLPWHAGVENYKRLFLNETNCLPLKTFSSLPLDVRMLPLSFYYEPVRKLLPALKFYSVRECLQTHLRVEITRNCHATWVQVQMPRARLAIDIRIICRPDFFVLLLPKNKMEVLTAMVLRIHLSQFLLFSQYPIMSPNFLNHCVIHQDFVEHVDNQNCFLEN